MGKAEKSIENIQKCICMKCPTYKSAYEKKSMPDDMTNMIKRDFSNMDNPERLFCASGKSRFIDEKKGCICESCPVYKENGLTSGYYCFEGVEE
jgi:hypothetical protein